MEKININYKGGKIYIMQNRKATHASLKQFQGLFADGDSSALAESLMHSKQRQVNSNSNGLAKGHAFLSIGIGKGANVRSSRTDIPTANSARGGATSWFSCLPAKSVKFKTQMNGSRKESN